MEAHTARSRGSILLTSLPEASYVILPAHYRPSESASCTTSAATSGNFRCQPRSSVLDRTLTQPDWTCLLPRHAHVIVAHACHRHARVSAPHARVIVARGCDYHGFFTEPLLHTPRRLASFQSIVFTDIHSNVSLHVSRLVHQKIFTEFHRFVTGFHSYFHVSLFLPLVH